MATDTTADAAEGIPPPSAALPHARTEPEWTVLASPGTRRPADAPVRLRRVLLQLAAAGVTVLVLVGIAGGLVSRRLAEKESVHDAARVTDLLAESVVQPVLTDAMASDPAAAEAGLDALVKQRVLSSSLVRMKLWTPDGLIVYSDEARLIGLTYRLGGDARSVFTDPRTEAEVSDLNRPENRYERSYGELLEVYRPVWTPSGRPLLLETYSRYDVVAERSSQLWRGFVGVTLSSLVAIFVLLIPLVWTLLARARRAQAQRERMMQRAVEASLDERRRIAATLHDGIVQELAAASFAVAGGAEAAAVRGHTELAESLREAAGSVRASLGGMRSLLVDIYPPILRSAGIAAALRDLATTTAGRDSAVSAEIDDAAAEGLSAEQQQAVFRVAQEALRNAAKHSGAARIVITLSDREGETVLSVSDDGGGFDVTATRDEDHFGLRLMADAANSIGATLRVRSSGAGTTWQLAVPGDHE